MPTQFTTASASEIALRVDSSSRTFARTGSTWPTTPYGLTKFASLGLLHATRTRQPALASRRTAYRPTNPDPPEYRDYSAACFHDFLNLSAISNYPCDTRRASQQCGRHSRILAWPLEKSCMFSPVGFPGAGRLSQLDFHVQWVKRQALGTSGEGRRWHRARDLHDGNGPGRATAYARLRKEIAQDAASCARDCQRTNEASDDMTKLKDL